MTTDSGGSAAEARSPFPQVRWRIERTADAGPQLLLWMSAPCDLKCHFSPIRIQMTDEEAWNLIRGADRVMSWATQAAEGTFSSGPDPAQAASQLAIMRYLVTSKDNESHTKLAQATPWAHWAEQMSATSEGITWLVDVFGVDDPQFLNMAMTFGATVLAAPSFTPSDGS